MLINWLYYISFFFQEIKWINKHREKYEYQTRLRPFKFNNRVPQNQDKHDGIYALLKSRKKRQKKLLMNSTSQT